MTVSTRRQEGTEMATIQGYVKNVTSEERKTGEPYRLLHLTKTANSDDTQITKVYDWDDLGGQVTQGTWQHFEIDERPATNGGLFRSLKGILDAPPSDAPPPQETPPAPQREDNALLRPDHIDGMIWGAVAHDAAAILGPNLPRQAGWPDDEWLAMAALAQDRLTRMLYEQRPR